MEEPHSSNFSVFTTNILGVRIFRKFTVDSMIYILAISKVSRFGAVIAVNIWTASSEFGTYCLCEQEGSGEPAHPRSLARTSAARS